MIIIVKMRRRCIVMLLLFFELSRQSAAAAAYIFVVVVLYWMREIARTTTARGGVRERKAAQEKAETIGYFIKNSANTKKISHWLLLISILLVIDECELLFLFCFYFYFFFRMLPSRLRPYYYTRNSLFVLLLSPNSILQSILV